jgi:SAM-dependent methyltransferase
MNAISSEPSRLLRLDLGCGKSKRPGFLGIDRRRFDGVDGVTDLTQKQWIFEDRELGGLRLIPFSGGGFTLPDSSVSEVFCAQFLEHLEHNQSRPERVRFMNEMWRVLVPGGKATIITPHWASNRAYGDFTHADKPVSEFFYAYLDKTWRLNQAPDNDASFNPDGYTCDFQSQLGHGINRALTESSAEERAFALAWYKEAADDLHAMLTARK